MTTTNLSNQYLLARNNMTISRYCGLIQSDGHISVVYNKDKTLNPRIQLTHTNKNPDWILGVRDWLLSIGIKSSLPKDPDKWDPNKTKRGVNLTIDRASCKNLIELIDQEEAKTGVPLLYDTKRQDFLLVKESIEIRNSSNASKIPRVQAAAMLVDIQQELKRGKIGPKGLTREQLIERLGFPGLDTTGAAKERIAEVNRQVEACGSLVLANLNPGSLHPTMAEFILGVFDGDGSIAVALFTHVEDGQVQKNRNAFEITPHLNVTDQALPTDGYLFKILNTAFGKGPKPYTFAVGQNKGGRRVQIRDKQALIKFAIPLFEKHTPTLEKNVIRFNTFKVVLAQLPGVYRSKAQAIKVVTFIYENGIYEFNKTIEEYLEIVELEFRKKHKKL